MKKAVVVSFNWNTQEIMFTDFEGDDAGRKAEGWVHEDSFVWRDFPASDGWTHFVHKNTECAESDGADMVDWLMSGGTRTLKIPQ
jgi:hypothetical protein